MDHPLYKKMFHVERLQTEEAAANLFVYISEVQQVGSEGANTHKVTKQKYARIFFLIEDNSTTKLKFQVSYIFGDRRA